MRKAQSVYLFWTCCSKGVSLHLLCFGRDSKAGGGVGKVYRKSRPAVSGVPGRSMVRGARLAFSGWSYFGSRAKIGETGYSGPIITGAIGWLLRSITRDTGLPSHTSDLWRAGRLAGLVREREWVGVLLGWWLQAVSQSSVFT